MGSTSKETRHDFIERMGLLDDAVAREGGQYVLPISNKDEARRQMHEIIKRDKEKQLAQQRQ